MKKSLYLSTLFCLFIHSTSTQAICTNTFILSVNGASCASTIASAAMFWAFHKMRSKHYDITQQMPVNDARQDYINAFERNFSKKHCCLYATAITSTFCFGTMTLGSLFAILLSTC